MSHIFRRFRIGESGSASRSRSGFFSRTFTSKSSATLGGENEAAREELESEPDVDLADEAAIVPDGKAPARSGPGRVGGPVEKRFKALRHNLSRSFTRKVNKGEDAEGSASQANLESSELAPDVPDEEAEPVQAMESVPWEDVRTSKDLAAQMDALLQKVAKSGKGSSRKEVQRQLQSLRDAVASEAWSLAEKTLAKDRRRVEHQLEMGRKSQSQGREMQAACMRELNELRDRMRNLPEGTQAVVDVHLCEPLQHVEEGVRDVVEVIVKDRLEEIVSKFSRGNANQLNLMIRQHVEKELQEARQESGSELRDRMFELQGRAAELLKQAASLREDLEKERKARSRLEEEKLRLEDEKERLEAKLAEKKRVEAKLEEERSLGHSLSQELEAAREEAAALRGAAEKRAGAGAASPKAQGHAGLEEELAQALLEAERLRAAAAEAQAEAERWRRAAAEAGAAQRPSGARACGEAADNSPASEQPGIGQLNNRLSSSSLASESRPVLPGASVTVLLEHAGKLSDRMGKDTKEASAASQDLIPALRQLSCQLDLEVREDALAARGVATGFDLLELRVSLAGREIDTMWDSWLLLLRNAEEASEAFKAPGNAAKKLSAVARQAAEASSAAKGSLTQCYSALSESCSTLEGPRREARSAGISTSQSFLSGASTKPVVPEGPPRSSSGTAAKLSPPEGAVPVAPPPPVSANPPPIPAAALARPASVTGSAARHDDEGEADGGVVGAAKSVPTKSPASCKASGERRKSLPSTPSHHAAAAAATRSSGGPLGLSGDNIMRARGGSARAAPAARK